jgi:hypothetical protein
MSERVFIDLTNDNSEDAVLIQDRYLISIDIGIRNYGIVIIKRSSSAHTVDEIVFWELVQLNEPFEPLHLAPEVARIVTRSLRVPAQG